jgi:glyoxylase-like metal-dependent hydrolase (beta-lactamase superfamily II)/rhodanese-related sulfurtransferase
MIEIVAIETPSLGDRGYLVTDGTAALVIDAQRDFDRILAPAADRGVRITHVFETHIHNDYVTGGLALARAVGASYHVNGADRVSFERTPIADGDVIEVGSMRIRVIGTPGHTFTHLSYALVEGAPAEGAPRQDALGEDALRQDSLGQGALGDGYARAPGGEAVIAVFTGGSLLNGSTGRTDLLGERHKVELARAQHGSARRLATELPDQAAVCPTHGFGSFCSAAATGGTSSTIGAEKRVNPVLTLDETEYVETLLAGLDDYPAYYAQMGAANAAGPLAPDLSAPRLAEPAELRRRIDAGEWVVDLRSRIAFAAGHLRGSLHFGLGDNLATYLGWLMPWGMTLTLIADTPQDVAAAQRELTRIGIDDLAAAATGAPPQWSGGERLETFDVADFAAYAAVRGRRPVVLLDVRRRSEWNTARVDGALHIPLHELTGRLGEIPGGEIWVHCQAGYRAAVAASLLNAAGRDVVLIDDDFGHARASGLARDASGMAGRESDRAGQALS